MSYRPPACVSSLTPVVSNLTIADPQPNPKLSFRVNKRSKILMATPVYLAYQYMSYSRLPLPAQIFMTVSLNLLASCATCKPHISSVSSRCVDPPPESFPMPPNRRRLRQRGYARVFQVPLVLEGLAADCWTKSVDLMWRNCSGCGQALASRA
ncbi:predicted protein [Histoplasma capsulatum G186AR]|uniref:Uncharacterized protein n=1 Tax=Ajellomyces capsulatus (strain G186AR / H82 / ATCC MYA-2454 / RMSCC 2432) TaxID=447093 RepID=C0NVR5_AJECG|nr:uncharacterized protein HCBG_07245 [Histoplasma capsulatum G186AR]EEH04604.1 predicted protein [Histoplasma capsulatum G186AR]